MSENIVSGKPLRAMSASKITRFLGKKVVLNSETGMRVVFLQSASISGDGCATGVVTEQGNKNKQYVCLSDVFELLH